MLNDDDDDDEILEILEAKTPSPLSSSADRSINEDEEEEEETSSGESSPSDLRKRLQHLPSPNQAARLASRVIDISRRLSRQRDYYFQGETNRIVENIEKEEAELDSPDATFAPRRSYSDLRAKDARARRRAKIRLENARNRAMVVSDSAETVASTRNDSSSQRSEGRSTSSESRAKERLEPGRDHRSILDLEMSTNNAHRQAFYSLSARSPSLYRREKPRDDPQRSSMYLRPYPVAASCENSPRDRIDAQSLSLPPSAKYRSCRGVILQNLSSGSEEAESGYEVTSDGREVAANQRIDRLMAATAREIGISSEVYETAKFQNDYLPPLSSRGSSNRCLLDPSRANAYHLENIVSSPSRMSFGLEANLYPSTRFPSTKKQSPFYRTLATVTSRSENGCRDAKGTMASNEEEPMFYSAREENLQNYGRSGECPRTPDETPIIPNDSPRAAETEMRGESSRDTAQLDALVYAETVVERSYDTMIDEREMVMNERLEKCPGEYPNEYSIETSAPEATYVIESNEYPTQYPHEYPSEASAPEATFENQPNQLPETIDEYPAYKNTTETEMGLNPSTIADAKALKQALSRCILTYDQENEGNFPPPDSIASPPEPLADRYCTSEDPSAGSTSRELYVGEFAPTEIESRNYYQPEYPDKSEMYSEEYSADAANDKGYANVPALSLNSQEDSYSTSPPSKGYTERLDTATLTVAPSNASLKQQATQRISKENSESRATPEAYVDGKTISIPESASPSPLIDDKTVSRPESSENTVSLEEHSTSFKENRSKASCRSLGTRSRIPVKIPTHRSKLSIVSCGKSTETGRVGSQGTSPIASSKRSFKSSPSSPESFHFGSSRVASGRVNKSRTNSPLVQSYKIIEKSPRSPLTDAANQQEIKRNREACTKDKSNTDGGEPTAFSLQISAATSDDDRSRSDGKSTGKEENRDRGDSAKLRNDTCRSSNYSSGSRKRENVSQSSKQRSVSSNSESRSRSVEEPVAELAVPENYVDPAIYIPKTPESPGDSPLLSYRANYYVGYEGEVYEKLPDTRKPNLFENHIGDGSCNEVQNSEERKFVSAHSSPEKEEFAEKNRAENRDRLRFSLEKLAAEQFRRSIGEQTRSIRSDTAAFLADSYYECPQFSSSTSKLRYEKSRDTPRFKKRSQDRFPFTISEKTSVASSKYKAPGQFSNLNEDRDETPGEDAKGNVNEDDEDEEDEDGRYKLHVHPSITRLAGAGLEDSVADVIGCAAEDELEDRETSGMKKLVQKFSARWNRSKRRDQVDENEPSRKLTNIIYRNRDYREECDSSVESYSESSLAKELDVFNDTDERASTKRSIDSPDEISSMICEQKSSIKESDTREISPRSPSSGENPCRRYDRDDLWVQAFKDLDSDREERNRENAEASRNDESVRSESKKDPYSLFFVKSDAATPETSGREVPSEDEKNVSADRRKNRVKFRGVVAPKRSDEKRNNDSENEIRRESVKSRNSERVRKNRNLQTGCLCLRFYRMIVPISFGSISKYRSASSSSARKKTRGRASPNKRNG